jgi:hypothetical protein
MRLVKVRRPLPMRKPIRSGQIIDIEGWTHGASQVRQGYFVPLTEQEEKEFLETATPETLEKIKVVPSAKTEISLADDEKQAEEASRETQKQPVDEANNDEPSTAEDHETGETGDAEISNPVEKIAVEPKKIVVKDKPAKKTAVKTVAKAKTGKSKK